MNLPQFLPLPNSLIDIQYYLKLADDYDSKDVSISYWCRMYAMQKGLIIHKLNGGHNKGELAFLQTVMRWLKCTNKEISTKARQAISDPNVAKTHLENVAMKFFFWADSKHRVKKCSKDVIEALFSTGALLEICCNMFAGPPEYKEYLMKNRQYVQLRGEYLQDCLSNNRDPNEESPEPKFMEKLNEILSEALVEDLFLDWNWNETGTIISVCTPEAGNRFYLQENKIQFEEVQNTLTVEEPVISSQVVAQHYPSLLFVNDEVNPSTAAVKSQKNPASAYLFENTDSGMESEKKSSSSSDSYKDDRTSLVQLKSIRMLDRNFLLQLKNSPASQLIPDGLPNLDIIRAQPTIRKKQAVVQMPKQSATRKVYDRHFLLKFKNAPASLLKPDWASKLEVIRKKPKISKKPGLSLDESSLKPLVQDMPVGLSDRSVRATEPMSKEVFQNALNNISKLKWWGNYSSSSSPNSSVFTLLLFEFRALDINSEERLVELTRLIFDKALEHSGHLTACTLLCNSLSKLEIPSSRSKQVNFIQLMFGYCQREIEKKSDFCMELEKKMKEFDVCKQEELKAVLAIELKELYDKIQMRSSNNLKFIGNLFNVGVISENMVNRSIQHLLSEAENEESVSSLCKLLMLIGQEMDSRLIKTAISSSQLQQVMVDSYYTQLCVILNGDKASKVICLKIKKVLDRRKNQWKHSKKSHDLTKSPTAHVAHDLKTTAAVLETLT